MPEENEGANKSTKDRLELLMFKALKQMDTDFMQRHEYEVHFVIPYNEDGGEVRGIINNFTASSPADAVRYVSEMYNFPEFDDDALDIMVSPENSRFGIIKVRKVLNDKIYTGEDILKSWEYIFNNYTRNVEIDSIGVRSDDNREEVLMSLIELFKLPRFNKLTDKYNIYDSTKYRSRRRNKNTGLI